MHYLIHFSLGFILSFLGSLPLGIINMTVAETTIRKGLFAGLLIATGASIIELIQAFVAIKFTHLFVGNPQLDFILNSVAILIFFSLAVYYFFFMKPKEQNRSPSSANKKMPLFYKGMLVSSMNVLVIPYWIFYGTYLSANGWLYSKIDFICIFCVGVMLGTFVLLLLYARLGLMVVNRAAQLTNYVNKFIGFVFLGFGVYQVWKVSTNVF